MDLGLYARHVVAADVLLILFLVVIVRMARKILNVDKEKRKKYMITVYFLVCEFVLQICEELLVGRNDTAFIVLNYIQQFIASALAPFIIAGMYLIYNDRNKKIVLVPILLNIVVLLLNFKYGFIYTIDKTNNYVVSQSLYMYSGILCGIFYFFVAKNLLTNLNNKSNSDIFLIRAIFYTPVIGAIFYFFTDANKILIAVAISLILYYIFLREEEFKKDPLTGVYTRLVFDNEVKNIYSNSLHKIIHIGVFDLNNFKSINDYYGHDVGDYVIRSAAKILHEAFGSYASIYRNGGDEFCMIAYDVNDSEIYRSIYELERLEEKWNQENSYELSIAKGFSKCTSENFSKFMTYYNEADKKMYIDKNQHKSKIKEGKYHE